MPRVPHSRVMCNKFQPKGSLRAFGWGVIHILRNPNRLSFQIIFLIINTRGKWPLTARQVGRYGQFKHISLLCTREQTLYLSHCSSYTKKKKIYIYGFRRFHGLLIHSLVSPKNMEISSQRFGDQSLKILIVQKCYLSGQIWNLILSLKETAVVRFELLQTKTKHYFYSGLRILHPFHCFIIWLYFE